MPLQTSSNFAKAHSLVASLDKIVVSGSALADHLVLGTYNFTPLYRHEELYVFKRQLDAAVGEERAARPHATLLDKVLVLTATLLALCVSILRRPSVLIYAIDKISSQDRDHDSRMDALYRFVRAKKIPFAEILHTMLTSSFIAHAIRRGRLSLYLEAGDVLYSLLRFTRPSLGAIEEQAFTDIPVEDRSILTMMAAERLKAIERSAFRIQWLRFVLGCMRPKALFAIDDPRFYGELLAACSEQDIPSYAFQHGHYTSYHLGFLAAGSLQGSVPSPTKLFVWSEYWKERLLQLCTYLSAEQIAVGGLAEPLPALQGVRAPGETLSVLIPYETVALKDEVAAYIRLLLAGSHVRVYFKLRPDLEKEVQLADYGLEEHERLFAVTTLASVVDQIDVVAGTYSTLLYDVIAYGLPVALLKTSSDYGVDIAQNGLAAFVEGTTTEEVVSVLSQRAALSQHERLALRTRLFGEAPPLFATLEALDAQHGLSS